MTEPGHLVAMIAKRPNAGLFTHRLRATSVMAFYSFWKAEEDPAGQQLWSPLRRRRSDSD
jgi:hypothetical protein